MSKNVKLLIMHRIIVYFLDVITKALRISAECLENKVLLDTLNTQVGGDHFDVGLQ